MSPGSGGAKQTVEATTLWLRESILDGSLEPGDGVSQVGLADKLGVSRTPVREAMRVLEHEGLVQASPNRQSRVRPVSAEDLDNLYGARIVVEALAAISSVPKLTTDDLRAMVTCMDRMDRQSSSDLPTAWDLPHTEFHRLVVSHAGGRVRNLAGLYRDHARRYRLRYLKQWRTDVTGAADHQDLLAASEHGDGAAAARVLSHHLARTALTLVTEIAPKHDPVMVRSAVRLIELRAEAEAAT